MGCTVSKSLIITMSSIALVNSFWCPNGQRAGLNNGCDCIVDVQCRSGICSSGHCASYRHLGDRCDAHADCQTSVAYCNQWHYSSGRCSLKRDVGRICWNDNAVCRHPYHCGAGKRCEN